MTQGQLREIWEKTQGHCHFCGDPLIFERRGWKEGDLAGYWEADHVIQHKKGGRSALDNYLPACTQCNRLRWHRTGDAIRELLLLGLVARDEVNRKSTLGARLLELREKKLAENLGRRRSSRPSSTGGPAATLAFDSTVKETGCPAGSVLVGVRSYNLGLRLRVSRGQEKGGGGRIKGGFEILSGGDGSYAAVLSKFVGRLASDAGDFVGLVQAEEPKASHFLNAGSLRVEVQ
jgi:hypothetical protein